jgi:membrane fusion protein, multidrug efflux system
MDLSRKGLALALTIVVIAAAAWFIFSPGSGGGPGAGFGRGGMAQPVHVVPARYEDFADRIEAIGTLLANESITVTAKAQGVIRSINFEDGKTVRENELIVSIAAAEEDARLNVELANLEEQRKTLDRNVDLAKSNNVSQARVDEQMAKVKKAEANVAAARARVSDFRIWAPFSGVLGTRKVSLGALVNPGTVITTLDDISVVKLDFAVPETFLSNLQPGLDIEATSQVYADEVFTGKVSSVDSRVDPVTRSVDIRAIILNDDQRLRPGMLMIVELIKNRRQSLMIPEQALMPDGTQQFVYVIGGEDIAERREVVIGSRRPGFVEIASGLVEGDLVVTDGTMQVRPGAKVQILTPNEAATSSPTTGERRLRQG